MVILDPIKLAIEINQSLNYLTKATEGLGIQYML